jgi:hypothetical protein
LQTKKPPTLELIKKMKKRCDDEASPITVTRITDHKNSFVSNVSEVKKFLGKDEVKLQLFDDKSPTIEDNNPYSQNNLSADKGS